MFTKVSKNFILIFCAFFITSTLCRPISAIEVDLQFINKIQRDSLKYFLEFTPPKTGLTKDSSTPGCPSSIAAVGFYLTSIIIAIENKWITKSTGFIKIKKTFNFLEKKVPTIHGFYFHFIDANTGKRAWGSEISTIDTALLMAGVLLCGEYFKGTKLEKQANRMYQKVEWNWLLNKNELISHGYKPETGRIPHYWDSYSEHIILQALAIGSPTFPIPASAWNQWSRLEEKIKGKNIVYCSNGSLFTYQYSHAFIDFQKLKDIEINYFENSIYASQENLEFCKKNSEKFQTYKEGFWGLSASLGPYGYKAYGATPGNPEHDGTVCPYSIISSIVFTPQISYSTIKKLYETYKRKIYGTYGFKGALNLDKNWFAKDYLAIDQGITILMLENYKTGLIWKYFMQLKPIKKWIKNCNLKNISCT